MHELGDFPRVRNQVTAADLKNAIEARHGGVATLFQSMPVREYFFGRKVWEAVVFVFVIDGCAGATRVYAWAELAGGQTERRIVTVLHQGAITSPKDAVTLRALQQRIRQQEILAELGVAALQGASFDKLLADTARLTAEGLQLQGRAGAPTFASGSPTISAASPLATSAQWRSWVRSAPDVLAAGAPA